MTYSNGSSQRHYFTGTEAVFGQAQPPVGSGAARLKTALVARRTQNHELRDDYRPGTRDSLEDVALDVSVLLSCSAYLMGGGTQGQAPDFSPIYKTAFVENALAAGTVAASPTPTTESFKLASGSLEPGEIAKLGDRMFVVTAKDDEDVLSIFPALPQVPVAGDLIGAAVNYNLTHGTPDPITCYRSDNVSGEIITGAKFSKFTFGFKQGGLCTVDAEGQGRELIRLLHTTLNGDINDVIDTVAVSHGGIESGAVLSCESELLLVTAVDATGKELVVVRGAFGSTAAAHLSGTAIGPYEPEEATSGAPIPGLFGGIWIDGETISAEEATVAVDEKTLYGSAYGDGGLASFVANPEKREVTLSITAYLNETALDKARAASKNMPVPVFLQGGKSNGRCCAVYLPKVLLDLEEIPDAKGELTKVTFVSRAVLAENGEDSFALAF